MARKVDRLPGCTLQLFGEEEHLVKQLEFLADTLLAGVA